MLSEEWNHSFSNYENINKKDKAVSNFISFKTNEEQFVKELKMSGFGPSRQNEIYKKTVDDRNKKLEEINKCADSYINRINNNGDGQMAFDKFTSYLLRITQNKNLVDKICTKIIENNGKISKGNLVTSFVN